MAAMIACGIGFQNALGALAPPEVAVHLTWAGGIRVNGAACGHLRAAASTTDPAATPDWLVIGLEVPVLPDTSPSPDRTCLHNEGCTELAPARLLEAWVRHTQVSLNRLEDGDRRGLHREWRALAHGIGETARLQTRNGTRTGTFVGTDENFGMMLRTGDHTDVLPLSSLLETGGPQ